MHLMNFNDPICEAGTEIFLLTGGYEANRGFGIDWGVMRAHALLQWIKRCVNNRVRNPSISRSLAASIRMAVSIDF
jgi:hypothetical protein